MKRRRIIVSSALEAVCIGLLSLSPAIASDDVKRSKVVGGEISFSTVDLSRVAEIGDPRALDWNDDHGHSFVVSPDRKWIAVVVRRGNPDDGSNEAQLVLFRSSQLLGRVGGDVVANFASTTNVQPISFVKWTDDSGSITFAATKNRTSAQAFRLDIKSREMTALTDAKDKLLSFAVSGSGRQVVATFAKPPASVADNPACKTRGCLVTGYNLYYSRDGNSSLPGEMVVIDSAANKRAVVSFPATDYPGVIRCDAPLVNGVSPSGRYGLELCYVSRWPSWWLSYSVSSMWLDLLRSGFDRVAAELFLIDFKSGLIKRVSDAPAIFALESPPLWFGDDSVVLAGALQSLQDRVGDDLSARSRHLAVLSLDPVTGELRRLASLPGSADTVKAEYWNVTTSELTLQLRGKSGGALGQVSYRRGARNTWSPVAPANDNSDQMLGEQVGQVRLSVEQDVNRPPKLIARSLAGNRRRVLLDPNAWIAQKNIGRVEEVSWTSQDGSDWHGGIYFPAGYVPGRRYPLVIQTHGFDAHIFAPGGASRNFAAQPLASRGIVVLQVRENTSGKTNTPAEWPTIEQGYESAIDLLSSRGLIDRSRVGIVGWSRTGPYVAYTITHSKYPFAAVAYTETEDYCGWWSYISTPSRDQELGCGAALYGEALNKWTKEAPSFNLDKVGAPVLMWSAYIEGLWDWYAGLHILGKPVEYWTFPDGTHDVFKVGQRINADTLLVDWFDFWLNDHEDLSSDKLAQYQRWRAMRRTGLAGR